MKEVDTITVHRFGSELLVELIGVDEYGDIASETIEFDLLNAESGDVIPREDIPLDSEEYIWSALSEKGYSIRKTDA